MTAEIDGLARPHRSVDLAQSLVLDPKSDGIPDSRPAIIDTWLLRLIQVDSRVGLFTYTASLGDIPLIRHVLKD